jgi:hypothetical protein
MCLLFPLDAVILRWGDIHRSVLDTVVLGAVAVPKVSLGMVVFHLLHAIDASCARHAPSKARLGRCSGTYVMPRSLVSREFWSSCAQRRHAPTFPEKQRNRGCANGHDSGAFPRTGHQLRKGERAVPVRMMENALPCCPSATCSPPHGLRPTDYAPGIRLSICPWQPRARCVPQTSLERVLRRTRNAGCALPADGLLSHTTTQDKTQYSGGISWEASSSTITEPQRNGSESLGWHFRTVRLLFA